MECPKCGSEMWDNRQKKTNPKAPDYKCKDKDCKGVIWPEKTQAPRQQAAPQAVKTDSTDILLELACNLACKHGEPGQDLSPLVWKYLCDLKKMKAGNWETEELGTFEESPF